MRKNIEKDIIYYENLHNNKFPDNKIKTTNHAEKEDAMIRVDFLNNLQQ